MKGKLSRSSASRFEILTVTLNRTIAVAGRKSMAQKLKIRFNTFFSTVYISVMSFKKIYYVQKCCLLSKNIDKESKLLFP